MILFYGSTVLVLVVLVVSFRNIWQLTRSMARPNLSFFSCLAMFIGGTATVGEVLLFRSPFAVTVLTAGLTVYAGALWLWCLTHASQSGPS